MILVYTHKITPRLTYIFKHIFIRILNVPVSFTNKVEEFVAHNGLKMTYSKVPLGKEFFVRNNDLLFEQGINDVEISVHEWDTVPCFFTTGKKSSIPYDIFAASFYLLSRYEEYLPHVQDEFERFPAEESFAFKNGFLEQPVIDIWAYKLLDELKKKFNEQEFVPKTYNYISTFGINQAYTYKYKGVVRTIGGFVSDFFTLKLTAFWDRIMVLLKFKKDPFDTYDKIVQLQHTYQIETSLFFLIANFTTYDTNISITKRKFRLLIKSMSDYVKVGLNASFFSMNNDELLKKETKKMESIVNTPVQKSRQYLSRVKFPETYQNLIDLEVEEDYSMCYATHLGFRASTCTPFYFYDLDFEIQTPLKVFSTPVTDTILNEEMQLSMRQALKKVEELCSSVRKVNGTFITLFHNDGLSNYGRWKGWVNLYEEVLKLAKEESK